MSECDPDVLQVLDEANTRWVQRWKAQKPKRRNRGLVLLALLIFAVGWLLYFAGRRKRK